MKCGMPSICSCEEVAFVMLDEKLWWGSRENYVPQCAGTCFSATALHAIPQAILQRSDEVQKYLEDNQFSFSTLKKRPFLQTNLKKNCVIYENHEKSFPSTHTFFLQSPNNNVSIRFYFIYWHSKPFLAKIASLPWLRSPCIPGLEKHSADMKSLTGCHQGIPFFISTC